MVPLFDLAERFGEYAVPVPLAAYSAPLSPPRCGPAPSALCSVVLPIRLAPVPLYPVGALLGPRMLNSQRLDAILSP